jgi:hypothetical protein
MPHAGASAGARGRAVSRCGLALGREIGERWKMQVTVTGKGRVAPHSVDRNAQQLRVVLAKLWKDFVAKRDLIATDQAPVGRMERQDYWLTYLSDPIA